MKLFYSIITVLFVLTPLLSSCQEDHDLFENSKEKPTDIWEDENEFTVIDGMIAKPEWLAETVDSIAKHYNPGISGKYPYPIVFKVSHAGTDYYEVLDVFSSMSNHPVFTLKGERITGDEARAIRNDKNKVVIWLDDMEEYLRLFPNEELVLY